MKPWIREIRERDREKLIAEIARLEAEIARKKALNDDLVAECTRDKAEITRLQAVNAELTAACRHLIEHLDDDDPLGGDTTYLDRSIEMANAALARALPQPVKEER